MNWMDTVYLIGNLIIWPIIIITLLLAGPVCSGISRHQKRKRAIEKRMALAMERQTLKQRKRRVYG